MPENDAWHFERKEARVFIHLFEMSRPQQVDIFQLGIGELNQLHQQLTYGVNNFMNSLIALQQTAGRFASAGQSVEQLKDAKQGQNILLPMTESLYVPGTLESVETVLLEVGTGYYVEKDIEGGVDYCRRKVMLIKDRVAQLSQIIQTRKDALQQISFFMNEKSKNVPSS